MKRLLDESEIEVVKVQNVNPLIIRLVITVGLTEGELFSRWRLAVKLYSVCTATRYSPLVRHAIIYYCTKHTTRRQFARFIGFRKFSQKGPFYDIRENCISEMMKSHDVDNMQTMLHEYVRFRQLSSRYIAGPGFKTIWMTNTITGITFPIIQDIAYHVRGTVSGGMDRFLGLSCFDAGAALIFIHHMRTTRPLDVIFLCIHHISWMYLVVYSDQTCKLFNGYEMTEDTIEGLLENCRLIIQADLTMGKNYRNLMLEEWDRACKKEGTSIEKIGFFLSKWYHS
jgi:hypothetical protein